MSSLERFKSAQASPSTGFAAALGELQAGAKTSHWIWYVFPQLAGLGFSPTAEAYALADLDEAIAYLNDPLLGARLAEITQVVAAQLTEGIPLRRLMGGNIDALKLVSSLTLFERAAEAAPTAAALPHLASFPAAAQQVLAIAERQGYPRCRYTLEHTERPRAPEQ